MLGAGPVGGAVQHCSATSSGARSTSVTTYVGRGLFAFGTVVVVVVAGLLRLAAAARPRGARARAGAGSTRSSSGPPCGRWRAVVRPAWRRVLVARSAEHSAGPARFVWHRVTPGELGLELTTLLALLAVGAFAFFFLGTLIDARRAAGSTTRAASVAAALDYAAVVDVVEVVTAPGLRAGDVRSLIAATAIWALVAPPAGRRRRARRRVAADLGARPPRQGRSTAVRGRPAATSTRRPGLSLGPRRLRGRPGRVRGRARARRLAAGATLRCGHRRAGGRRWWWRLSRVYLRVHYLSDVLGGVALGTAVFALVGCVALVVAYVRDNPVPARV